jgi:hypothetical protein
MTCTSKKLQLLKHVTGSLNQVFLLVAASFAGTWSAGVTPWYYVPISGEIGMILSRISNQLDYWQNKHIIREELDRRNSKIKELESKIVDLEKLVKRGKI